MYRGVYSGVSPPLKGGKRNQRFKNREEKSKGKRKRKVKKEEKEKGKRKKEKVKKKYKERKPVISIPAFVFKQRKGKEKVLKEGRKKQKETVLISLPRISCHIFRFRHLWKIKNLKQK